MSRGERKSNSYESRFNPGRPSQTRLVNEAQRDALRKRVDEARRGVLAKHGELRQELNARSPEEVKQQTAERKAIFAAQLAHDADLKPLAIVASGGGDVYLVSVGGGRGRVLDLRERAPSLSAAVDFYELVASRAEWLPFIGDSDGIVATAARIIDAS
jgi:hypothetical protein